MHGRIQNKCLRKWNATPTRMASVKTISPKRPKKTRPKITQAKSNVKTSNVATICHCSLESSLGFAKVLITLFEPVKLLGFRKCFGACAGVALGVGLSRQPDRRLTVGVSRVFGASH
jgi:hypothetical protein